MMIGILFVSGELWENKLNRLIAIGFWKYLVSIEKEKLVLNLRKIRFVDPVAVEQRISLERCFPAADVGTIIVAIDYSMNVTFFERSHQEETLKKISRRWRNDRRKGSGNVEMRNFLLETYETSDKKNQNEQSYDVGARSIGRENLLRVA